MTRVLPRMRTITECVKLLREDDPHTAITQNALRSMVASGNIPHMMVGNKRLVNYDGLLEVLQNPLWHSRTSEAENAMSGKVRRID